MDVIRQLAAPVSPAAIATALRLAEAGIRLAGGQTWCGEPYAAVYSADGRRSVQFTALSGGRVRVTHTVVEHVYRDRYYQSEKWGTERTTILEATDARAVRALAILRTLPAPEPSRSHGS